jgi:hypothetical protein
LHKLEGVLNLPVFHFIGQACVHAQLGGGRVDYVRLVNVLKLGARGDEVDIDQYDA